MRKIEVVKFLCNSLEEAKEEEEEEKKNVPRLTYEMDESCLCLVPGSWILDSVSVRSFLQYIAHELHAYNDEKIILKGIVNCSIYLFLLQ